MAVAVAVGVALAAAGCGDSNQRPVASIKSVPTTPGTGSPAVKGSGKTERGAGQAKPGSSRGGSSQLPALPAQPGAGGSSQLQRAVSRAIQRLPRGKRDSYVTATALAVFAGFGFDGMQVVLSGGGTDVRGVMDRGQACSARAETEDNVTSTVRNAIPWLASMQVVVQPGGERLSRYVRAHCRPPALPGGAGEVVFSGQGVGLGKTRQFTVRSSRWTVEYLNGGRSLHMLVLGDRSSSSAPLDAAGRGPGRRTFSGPGTFSLQIAGTGEWLVRVRDGA